MCIHATWHVDAWCHVHRWPQLCEYMTIQHANTWILSMQSHELIHVTAWCPDCNIGTIFVSIKRMITTLIHSNVCLWTIMTERTSVNWTGIFFLKYFYCDLYLAYLKSISWSSLGHGVQLVYSPTFILFISCFYYSYC